LENVKRVISPKAGHRPIGVSMALCRGRTVFIADTTVHEMPDSEELADIAVEAAGVVRRFGYEPRVAFLSYSTFGHPRGERSDKVREAVEVLDARGTADFEYEGDMAADVALSMDAMAPYPFCRLTAPANVLVMPAAHSASITTKMLQQLGGATVIGPFMVGYEKSVQIAQLSATAAELVNMAAIAAYDING
ncbi:MAG: phosphate acyltransferase, partial [Pseudomonadota bacterium]